MFRALWYKIGMILTIVTCLMCFVIFCGIGLGMIDVERHGDLWGVSSPAPPTIPSQTQPVP